MDKIKILKNNSDYRLSDIIYHYGKGNRWIHSGKQILRNNKYKNTILQEYLIKNGLYYNINYNLLLKIVKKHSYNKILPDKNTLVIHLRLGDAIDYYNFNNKKDFIEIIKKYIENNKNINKIVICTCYAYNEWSKDSLKLKPDNVNLWNYSEEKQKRNELYVENLFNKIKNNFRNIELDVFSNIDIDNDICYCVNAKYFINDDGGFSKLLLKLNEYINGKNIKINKNIQFIHIGKCGGTFLSQFFENKIHMNKPKFNKNIKYVIWIKNPLKRFISAFYHSYNLIKYDISNKSDNELLNNKSSPYYELKQHLESKKKYNNPFNLKNWNGLKEALLYQNLILFFNNPNHLAESLYCNNKEKQKKAHLLMSIIKIEHLHKGIGWYLDNGEFIKKYYKNILYVGTTENMENDLEKLFKKINYKNDFYEKELRVNKNSNNNKFLSKKAIKNLIEYYKYSDYKTLFIMKKYNLISNEILNNYFKI